MKGQDESGALVGIPGTATSDCPASRLSSLAAGWADLPSQAGGDAGRVDLIRALEVVKAAASAAQARLAADLDASQRAAQAAAGVPAGELGRGVGAQVALARRDSPHRGSRHLGLATALVHEMPHALAALQDGRISEWRATLLVRETAALTVEHRAAVDAELAGDEDRLRVLEQLGDRALAARAKQAAYRLDPRSVVERARRAVGERCVTVRPAPDTMAYLTALLPARDAIAAHTALGRVAEAARNHGDPRGRGQLMADALVDRLTASAGTAGTAVPADAPGDGVLSGWAATIAATTWEAAGPAGPAPGRGASGGGAGGALGAPGAPSSPPTRHGDVAVRLVMTDRALLDWDDEPAHLDGYGPVPAAWARGLVADVLDGGDAGRTSEPTGSPGSPGSPGRELDPQARVFLTRLLTDPHGALVGLESRARTAPPGLAAFIRTRDGGTCRTPWCDAPVRHVDHVVPHADGGPTSSGNLQGLCERCNYERQAVGWPATAHDPPDEGTQPSDESTRPPDEGMRPPRRHTVSVVTPTGHRYVSVAPPLPGSSNASSSPRPEGVTGTTDHPTETPGSTADDSWVDDSWVEAWLRDHLATAA